MENENVMTKQSHDCGRLEGTEAFGLYLSEIATSVQAISQQSALLLQALSERAVLLADMAGQAEVTEPASGQESGKTSAAGGDITSALAEANSKPTVI
jgi:hypothetical protein